MSNYVKATNFAVKDGLVTTDPAKVIKGTDIDNEYNAIASAIASKADTNSPTFTGTPAAPTATSGSNTTQVATTAFVSDALSALIPSGMIMLWSGATSSIPSGWVLCNGSNSTPDLRNRFVVGAGSTYSVGATGGSADATLVSHSHTITTSISDPGHGHGPLGLMDLNGGGGNLGGGVQTFGTTSTNNAATGITASSSASSSGSSATNANLPPYYALAYIMKS